MQRVASLVKLCQSLNYETMITAVRMKDPAKFADTIAANLPLSIAEKQRLLEIFDPAERLSRVGDLLEIVIKQEPETDPIQCLPMGPIEGTLYIRWANGTQASATPRYKLMFSRYKNPWEGVHITSREGLYNLLVNYRSGDMWSPKGGARPSKLLVGSDGLESYSNRHTIQTG
jgi:hypothetical protein